jgi:hypothetical protein
MVGTVRMQMQRLIRAAIKHFLLNADTKKRNQIYLEKQQINVSIQHDQILNLTGAFHASTE